ncbi:MAG: galactokinase [Saprospiraceae bacterium]
MKKVLVKAPGRINIIGEHTDYNDGFVLPAAIDKYIEFEIQTDSSIHFSTITAIDKGENLKFLVQDEGSLFGGWGNYIQGVVQVLNQLRPGQIKNFTGSFKGNIPQGSGLSSSAALEMSLALGLNSLFNLQLNDLELIKAAQIAEHKYVGTQCGIMDQFASMMGRANHSILLDCKTLDYDYIPMQMHDCRWLIINSNVHHELSSTAYNQRRNECQEGVEILRKYEGNITSLRDITPAILDFNKHSFPPIIYNRCLHVVEENLRVLQVVEAMERGNVQSIGEKITASHISLRDLYEVSCPEIDFLVEKVLKLDGVLGARMMGGGFGGCTLNLLHQSFNEAQLVPLLETYKNQFGIAPDILPFRVVDGAHLIE